MSARDRRRARRLTQAKRPAPVPDAPPEPRTPIGVAWVVVRHAIPIVVLLASGGSIAVFVMLTIFNLALTIAAFNAIKLATGLMQGDGREPPSLPSGEAVNVAGVALAQAVFLTGFFGGWAPLFATGSFAYLAEPELWWGGLLLFVAAIPEVVTRVWQRAHSGVHPGSFGARDHLRLRRAFLGLVAGYIGGIVLSGLRGYGLWLMAIGYTAVSLYYELFPERIGAPEPEPGTDPAR